MVYVFLVLACGLVVAAIKAEEKSSRYWFLVWAALNIAGAVKAVVTDDPWAFRLKPNNGVYDEPVYRRP